MRVEWKHRKAESEVSPLLACAARLDPGLVSTFPRPVEEVVAAAISAAFESHRGLTESKVVEVLGDVYGVDHGDLLAGGDSPLAGYTYACGHFAVIFSDPQYGEACERFTRAHEGGHLAVEYLPLLARSRQHQLFGGTVLPSYFARRDPPGNIFLGHADRRGIPVSLRDDIEHLQVDRQSWLREVIANSCAAELLAPHREVARYVDQLPPGSELVAAVRDHFGLSQRAAEVRLADLGLVTSTTTCVFLLDSK